jgi:hypothetical protein
MTQQRSELIDRLQVFQARRAQASAPDRANPS